MIILGIDPGLSGALAWYDGSTVETQDIPSIAAASKGREVDWSALYLKLAFNAFPGHVFIERVGAMPGQGVSSMFKFGYVAGGLRGLVAGLGVPVTMVTPQAWKKALGVPAGKDGARARASELLPHAAHQWQRVKDDGRAEAALIALYGWRSFERIAA